MKILSLTFASLVTIGSAFAQGFVPSYNITKFAGTDLITVGAWWDQWQSKHGIIATQSGTMMPAGASSMYLMFEFTSYNYLRGGNNSGHVFFGIRGNYELFDYPSNPSVYRMKGNGVVVGNVSGYTNAYNSNSAPVPNCVATTGASSIAIENFWYKRDGANPAIPDPTVYSNCLYGSLTEYPMQDNVPYRIYLRSTKSGGPSNPCPSGVAWISYRVEQKYYDEWQALMEKGACVDDTMPLNGDFGGWFFGEYGSNRPTNEAWAIHLRNVAWGYY